MSFGRRTFVEFKPRLEKLLKEVVLVSELAALAEEAELVATEERMEVDKNIDGHQRNCSVSFLGDVSWSNASRRRAPSPSKIAGSDARDERIYDLDDDVDDEVDDVVDDVVDELEEDDKQAEQGDVVDAEAGEDGVDDSDSEDEVVDEVVDDEVVDYLH